MGRFGGFGSVLVSQCSPSFGKQDLLPFIVVHCCSLTNQRESLPNGRDSMVLHTANEKDLVTSQKSENCDVCSLKTVEEVVIYYMSHKLVTSI